MDSTHSTTSDASSKQHSWARDQISQLVHQIRLDRHDGKSLNSSASQHHVARTTAQNWLRNCCRLEQEGGLASYDEVTECSIDTLMLHFDCFVS